MLHRMGARLARAVLTLSVSLALLGGAVTSSAQAQQKLPPPVVAVVDVQAIQRDAAAAQSARSQRDQYLQRYQGEFENGRKALKDTESDLMRQKATLAPEAWAAKAREFEQRVAEYNKRYQSVLQAVEKSYAQAMNEMMAAAIEVTGEVAGQYGANLVLHKQQVFLHDQGMDVTAVVLEKLNKKKPSVTFPAPAVGEGGGAAAPAKPKSGKK